ncbi:unnamed protein product [Amoebophrya sp. A120]|nr:unnamed protein product [Amoebophrya sp. A120]|eukprot:GSA120T00020149001.1
MGLFGFSSSASKNPPDKNYTGNLNPPVTKAQLKMACGRAKIMRNKITAATKALQKEVALLLREGQESRAKIKAEQILQNINLCDALDLIDTMAELVATRINFVQEQPTCPTDLLQPISSLLYANNRAPVEELEKVTQQFHSKYGIEFVQQAKQQGINVHPRLIKLLSVHPPTNAEMLSILKDAATYYRIDSWEPSAELLRESGEAEPMDLLEFADAQMTAPAAQAANTTTPAQQVQPQQFQQPVIVQQPGLMFPLAGGGAPPGPHFGGQPAAVNLQPAATGSLIINGANGAVPSNNSLPPTGTNFSALDAPDLLSGGNVEMKPAASSATVVLTPVASTAATSPDEQMQQQGGNEQKQSSNISSGQDFIPPSVPASQPFVTAVIPEGYSAGMVLQVHTACGKQLAVVLPENAQPGQTIQIPYEPNHTNVEERQPMNHSCSSIINKDAATGPSVGSAVDLPFQEASSTLGPPAPTVDDVLTQKAPPPAGPSAAAAEGFGSGSMAIDPATLGYQPQYLDGSAEKSTTPRQKENDLDDLMKRFNALKQ